MLRIDRVTLMQDGFRLLADWDIPASTKVAVIGPSGAGKSTLLAAISGFLAPAAGRILWRDQDLGPLAPGLRPVTSLFQDHNLFPHLSVAQNVGLGVRPDLRLSSDQKADVRRCLDRVGLAGLEERRPAQLSGGQIGRVALARALLRARPILLLDEPFAALGPALKAEMLALVSEVAAETGALVLMVTHEPRDALTFADLTILVAQGVAQRPVATSLLFDQPPPALRDYLGQQM